MDGSIMIYDLQGIRERRKKADEIKQEKCRITFRTRPYMQELAVKELLLEPEDAQYRVKRKLVQAGNSQASATGPVGRASWWKQALRNSA